MLLLSRDELADVLLCLTRFNILMMAFASRKVRAAVDALPPNRCLLELASINLTKKWDYSWHNPRVLFGRVRRRLSRFVEEAVRPYKLRICPASDDRKPVSRRSLSYSDLIPAFLRAVRNASVYYVCIDLAQIPRQLEQLLRQSAATSGCIQEIVVNVDWRRLSPSVFEVLPLLAAEVASLRLQSYPINWRSCATPPHPSEKLLRNCIDRGVYSLKLLDIERHCHMSYTPAEKSSDIREESILEFCFAPRNIRPDRPAQVELQLNCINLSPAFLSRFIHASETCDSDHTVKLMLRGANAPTYASRTCRSSVPTISGRDGFGASIWTNEGKCAVRVVRNLQTGFFFAHRSTLQFEEWRKDDDRLIPSEFDEWVFVRPMAL